MNVHSFSGGSLDVTSLGAKCTTFLQTHCNINLNIGKTNCLHSHASKYKSSFNHSLWNQKYYLLIILYFVLFQVICGTCQTPIRNSAFCSHHIISHGENVNLKVLKPFFCEKEGRFGHQEFTLNIHPATVCQLIKDKKNPEIDLINMQLIQGMFCS